MSKNWYQVIASGKQPVPQAGYGDLSCVFSSSQPFLRLDRVGTTHRSVMNTLVFIPISILRCRASHQALVHKYSTNVLIWEGINGYQETRWSQSRTWSGDQRELGHHYKRRPSVKNVTRSGDRRQPKKTLLRGEEGVEGTATCARRGSDGCGVKACMQINR